MQYRYKTSGVCSEEILLDIEDGIIQDVRFVRGCAGNTLGISSLCKGMPAEDIQKKLKGIQCGSKGTSCPDQLAAAIQEAMDQNN